MGSDDFLKEYRAKRNFDRTAEPFGVKAKGSAEPVFVIQKHRASQLHYDFRIEVDDVLKSWAVPKGPSTDPTDKRMAVPTEDHPLEYAHFEGVIPEGEYGAGTVMIWDAGNYRNLKAEGNDDKKSVKASLEDGHMTIWLEGHKLKGGYALIRTGKGKNERWLLIKMDDDEADARRNPVSTEPDSVLSGKSLDEIEQASEKKKNEK